MKLELKVIPTDKYSLNILEKYIKTEIKVPLGELKEEAYEDYTKIEVEFLYNDSKPPADYLRKNRMRGLFQTLYEIGEFNNLYKVVK